MHLVELAKITRSEGWFVAFDSSVASNSTGSLKVSDLFVV